MTLPRAARTERRVRVGALEFRVLTDDSPPDSEYRPAVLIHGIGMSHRYFARLHNELERDREVVSIDLPGFAGLPKPGRDVDIAEMAAALGEVVDGLQLGPITLVGQSMGSQWTTELAVERPDLVASLVLIGPVTNDRARTLPAQMTALGVDTLVEPPGGNAIVFTDYVRCGVPWYLVQVRHMLAFRLEHRIAAVEAPVLLLRGGVDPIAPMRWCRELRGRAKGASLVTVPGRAHNVQHSAPRAVASAIRAFVDTDADATR